MFDRTEAFYNSKKYFSWYRDKKKKKKKNKAKELLQVATKTKKQNGSDNEEGREDEEQMPGSSQRNVLKKTAAELAFEKANERRVWDIYIIKDILLCGTPGFIREELIILHCLYSF